MVDSLVKDGNGFDRQRLKAQGEAAADALREELAGALREQMGQFVLKAQEAAVDLGSASSHEVRDAVTVLRLRANALRDALVDELRRNFDPDAEQRAMQATMSISVDELTLQNPESLDESIAVTNVGNRGELLYEHQLWEIRQRMEWWREERYPRVSDKSLAPYAICRAFFEAMRKAGIPREHHLTLCWQFDRYVMRHLHDMYEELIKIFDRHGFTPLRPVAQAPKAQPSKSADPPTAAPEPPASTSTPAPPAAAGPSAAASASAEPASPESGRPAIDPQTWQLLSQLGELPSAAASAASPAGAPAGPAPASAAPGQSTDRGSTPAGPTDTTGAATYSDQQLAHELTALLSGQPVPGWRPEQARELGTRVSVVGRAFNQMLADPNLARSVKPQFDSLRFSILKTALADPSFFRDPGHPMRTLLNELAQLATTSRLYTPDEVSRMGRMLGSLHQQFAVGAEAVRDARHDEHGVSEEELEHFLDDMQDDQKARRAALIEKSRRVVSEELWLQTAARRCPDTLHAALEAAWEPMMALRLLRYGVDSTLWNRGIGLLKRVVDLADPPSGVSHSDADRQQLLKEFQDELRNVGMLEERVGGLVIALESGLVEAREVTQPAPQVDTAPGELVIRQDSPTELLRAALVPNSWYEVFDRDRDAVRWLQAQGLDETERKACFAEFRNKDELKVPVDQFIQDLREGQSAAINPTPKARAALNELTRQD